MTVLIQSARLRLPTFARSWSARIGLALVGLILLLTLVGPFLAPYSPTELGASPYIGPSRAHFLGSDFLGRDVLSRLLYGGRTVIALAGLATLLAYIGGALVGLVAGFTRSVVDPLLMRAMDVLLAFPPILFLLVLATGAGATPAAVVIGIAIIQMPGIARVIRAATLETSVRGYVEAAVARGEPTWRILRREIFPNIVSTIVADGGPRFTVSILLVAGLNFLGLGIRPPAADWAVMISENRTGLTVNPWAVVAPALVIGALTVSVNLVADSIARSRGISADRDVIRR